MKKRLALLYVAVALFLGLFFTFSIEVTTQQGVNYIQRTIKIPLYIKVLNFYDRHYNYKELTKRIIKGAKNDEEKVLKIFLWTKENLKSQPDSLPVVDDHVWHIIVRGYGVADQYSDVFTTLCNYAGIEAFFAWVSTKDNKKRIPFSFVKLGGKWTVFDPYYHVFFKSRKGGLIGVNEVKSGSTWLAESGGKPLEIDYGAYLDNLPLVKKIGLRRANIQSPLNRLWFQLNQYFHNNQQ